MKNKKFLVLGILFVGMVIFVSLYSRIEFYNGNYLYMMSYSKNWEESEDVEVIEQELCYDESYSYNKDKDISIIDWEYRGFLFFKWFKVKYEKGNICSSEFLLEETYIKFFLESAEIISNEDNVDVSKLIKGKKAIVGNIKYPLNDEYNYIEYVLDGESREMFVSTNEAGLLIIQVGLSDEGAKYIAYK